MNDRYRTLSWIWLAIAMALAGAESTAMGDELAHRAQTIAQDTMSPFCPGKTIDSCPSPYAAAWRADIRTWLSQGATAKQIRARLQQRVPGFDLEGRPGRSWDWALPGFALALVTVWLALQIRRIRPNADRDPSCDVSENDDADLNARLDAELAR